MASEKTPLLGTTEDVVTNSDASTSSKTTVEKKKSSWTRQQILIAGALSLQNVCFAISFGVIAPFYPNEAAKKGASKTAVGLVFGVFQLVIFVTSPIYGNYIHKIGAKYMFISGSFILGGCITCFGFLDACPDGVVYVVMCFVCRSIEANGSAMLITASFAIMAKTFPDDIGKAMGILETFSGIGMVLGPSIGGGLYSVGGFRLPFIVMGCLIWFITTISFFLLPRIEDMTRIEGSFLQLMKIPGCIVIYFVITSCAIALTFLDPTFSPFMVDTFNLNPGQIGLIFMISPGVYALTAPLAGFVSDKGWNASSCVVGMLICAFAFLLLGPSPIFQSFIPTTIPETIVGLTVMGLSIGFALIPVFPLVINLAKNRGFDDGIQTLGIVSGYFNSAFSFGGFLGPTVAGYLDEIYGFAGSSTACAAIIIFFAIVFTIYVSYQVYSNSWPIPVPEVSAQTNQHNTDDVNSVPNV